MGPSSLEVLASAVYVVYADEAWTHDPRLRFWRFYGGALLSSRDRERIDHDLNGLKAQLGLIGEVKWSRVRDVNWERYAVLIDRFLDLVDAGTIKLRYMWLDQQFQNPAALNDYHLETGYYILYYLFLVLAFGLPWHDEREGVEIEFFPDQLPDQPEKRREFIRFLKSCHLARRYEGRSDFRIINVGDVPSRKHLILQCVDVIIGAIGFRLNHMHKVLQDNGRRATGTKVKERLYKAIIARLRAIDMAERGTRDFSIGHSTGINNDIVNRWRHKFRQWDFKQPGTFNPDWIRR